MTLSTMMNEVFMPDYFTLNRNYPNLIALVNMISHHLFETRAIKVGCGLGDDAEWLAKL